MVKKELILEYFVPIESRAEIDGEFTIQGIAINEPTTSNNHKFLGEELKLAANTLVGVPLLKDHNNSVDAIVGKVKSAFFNEDTRNIPFKAIIKDPTMKQKVKDGLINSVSVGAHLDPNNIEEDEDGSIIPRGIVFKELSLVAVPADAGATFDIALNNAYNGFKSESQSKDNLTTNERGSMNMTEEEKNSTSEAEESIVTEETKEVTEEKAEITEEAVESTNEKILSLLSNMDKRLSKIEASDVDEEKEEPKEEPKPKEEPEEEDEDAVEEKFTILQNGAAFTVEKKSYVYN